MKIRSGFVSNSSSSSFVMLGSKIDLRDLCNNKMIDLMNQYNIKYDNKWLENAFWDALYNGTFSGLTYFSEEEIIGRIINSDLEYSDITNTSLKEVITIAKEVKDAVKEVFDIDIEVKLMSGCRAC